MIKAIFLTSGCAALLSLFQLNVSSVDAQVPRPDVQFTIGRLHHQSDLHEYYALRFEDGPALGIGVTFPVRKSLDVRFLIESASSHLTGAQIDERHSRDTKDHRLTIQTQILAKFPVSRFLTPYVGGGAGFRRFQVNSEVLGGDIVWAPWKEPQLQPIVSVVGGLSTPPLGNRATVFAEIRYSIARFRAGEDSWGLPEDPIDWQREIQPNAGFAISF